MPANETTKEKARRISTDYYKHPDRLETWKNRFAMLAVVISAALAGTSFALNDQRDFGASRAPVASVHHTFGMQCNACHVDATPMSSHSFAPDWFVNLVGIDRMASVKKCQECHMGPKNADKPYQSDHHTGQNPSLTCASCHRDHQGFNASLVRLPDSDCTQCHKDLGTQENAWHKEFKQSVPRFADHDDAHPEFRSIKNDPGKLKFSHQQHLTPGIAITDVNGKKGGTLKLLKDIPEELRHRYESDDLGNVKLNCASCHQLDAGNSMKDPKDNPIARFPASLLGQRNGGAYMLPVTYENHCQACHPLTLSHKLDDNAKPGYLTIPHRMPVNQIHDMLNNFFTAKVAQGKAKADETEKTTPLPGKALDKADLAKVANAVKEAEEGFFNQRTDKKANPGVRDSKGTFYLDESQLAADEKRLYVGRQMCAECHHFDKNVATAIKPGTPPDLVIEPVQVPSVWFKHAKFNHTAHRAVDCKSCHAKADGSVDATDVLIPNRDNCAQCHVPTTKAGTPGARSQCTECHTYHNRAESGNLMQGIGATNRNPKELRTIDRFLRPVP